MSQHGLTHSRSGTYKDRVHFFAGIDLEDRRLLHMTIWDDSLQHVHYKFEYLDENNQFDMTDYLEDFRKEIYGPEPHETNRLLGNGTKKMEC